MSGIGKLLVAGGCRLFGMGGFQRQVGRGVGGEIRVKYIVLLYRELVAGEYVNGVKCQDIVLTFTLMNPSRQAFNELQ